VLDGVVDGDDGEVLDVVVEGDVVPCCGSYWNHTSLHYSSSRSCGTH